jgi:chromosome segregation ATPase
MTRQEALMSLHTLAKPIYEATEAMERLAGQLTEASDLISEHDELPETLTTELEALEDDLSSIQSELGTVRNNAGIAADIQASSTLPTSDQLWQVDEAWDAMPNLLEQLNELILNRLPAFYTMLDSEGVRPHPGDAITLPSRRRRR